MKNALDPALRDGYQEIINHGYTYNDPTDETEPFHEMFASSVIRHTEPWWQYYHHFTSYACALLLCWRSQGRFVEMRIAVLSPHATTLRARWVRRWERIGRRRRVDQVV